MDLRTIDDSRIAMSVLDICIRLRETDDFRSAMRDVTNEIRGLCYAEYCCILLVDDTERSCSVLSEAFAKGSHLLPMDSYLIQRFIISRRRGGRCFPTAVVSWREMMRI